MQWREQAVEGGVIENSYSTYQDIGELEQSLHSLRLLLGLVCVHAVLCHITLVRCACVCVSALHQHLSTSTHSPKCPHANTSHLNHTMNHAIVTRLTRGHVISAATQHNTHTATCEHHTPCHTSPASRLHQVFDVPHMQLHLCLRVGDQTRHHDL